MVTEALRRAMAAAGGAGTLEGDGVRHGRAEHPVCGDAVRVDVRLRDGVIEELAWGARGCPAAMAVAAVAPAALRGGRLADAPARLRRALEELGGLQPHERHAERLLLDALRRAR